MLGEVFHLIWNIKSPYFCFQRDCAGSGGTEAEDPVFCSLKKWYPDLQEYCPFSTCGQKTKSGAAVFDKGIFFLLNSPLVEQKSHLSFHGSKFYYPS